MPPIKCILSRTSCTIMLPPASNTSSLAPLVWYPAPKRPPIWYSKPLLDALYPQHITPCDTSYLVPPLWHSLCLKPYLVQYPPNLVPLISSTTSILYPSCLSKPRGTPYSITSPSGTLPLWSEIHWSCVAMEKRVGWRVVCVGLAASAGFYR